MLEDGMYGNLGIAQPIRAQPRPEVGDPRRIIPGRFFPRRETWEAWEIKKNLRWEAYADKSCLGIVRETSLFHTWTIVTLVVADAVGT